jgi:hypothetical protein
VGRQSQRLLPEEEVVAFCYLCFRVVPGRVPGKYEKIPLSTPLFEERFKIGMMADIDLMPVIQTRPFQVFVIDFETQGMNQVERNFGGSAQPRDISSVGRYLRPVKHNMEIGILNNPVFDPGNIAGHWRVLDIQTFHKRDMSI